MTKMAANPGSTLLLLAGISSALAALAHVACMAIGPKAFSAMGAGPVLIRMVNAGHWYPYAITSAIALVLLGFAYFAWAGAGKVPRPPFLEFGLIAISLLFLARAAILVPATFWYFSGRTVVYLSGSGGPVSFWIWSSLACLILAALYIEGTVRAWSSL